MKMRILIFGLTKVVGGIESYIRNLIYNIDREKYYFDFMIVGEEEKACFEDEFNELFDDGKEHFFHCPNMKKGFISTNRWLREFYESHHYDLIYMNVTTAARIMYCNYAVTKQGVPLITHNHCGNAVSKLASINNNVFKRYTTKKSAVKLACSDEAFSYGFSCDRSAGRIIQNGISVEQFTFNQEYRSEMRSNLGISEDQVVIGHIGRFAIEKNQRYFVELSKLLGNKYVFACIGEGEQKESVVSYIKEKGVVDSFRILPFSKQTEKYYSMMDIFAMPSLYEGLPLVAVEAQASGLPCIFSDSISRQSDICGHSRFISLETPDRWVEALRNSSKKRFDNRQKLIDAGFDASSTAVLISNLFDSTRK